MGYYLTKDELYHHGILGQKWGIRRYQNEDGTLTEAGKKRYAKEITKELNKASREKARAIAKISGVDTWRDIDRLNRKIDKQLDKNEAGAKNYKKIEKLNARLNKKKMRMQDLYDQVQESNSKINSLINELSKTNEYVWKTSPAYYMNNANWFSNESYYQNVRGTRYKVKTANEKRKNSRKWNNRHSEYPVLPVHTAYYYY